MEIKKEIYTREGVSEWERERKFSNKKNNITYRERVGKLISLSLSLCQIYLNDDQRIKYTLTHTHTTTSTPILSPRQSNFQDDVIDVNTLLAHYVIIVECALANVSRSLFTYRILRMFNNHTHKTILNFICNRRDLNKTIHNLYDKAY